MDVARAIALLVARIALAGLFVWDGQLMLRAWEATHNYMEAYGVPGVLLPLAALFQICGGLAVAAGFATRPLALAFVGFALLTAVIFHTDFADTGQLIHLGKNIAIAGGFLVLFVSGPGRISLDGRFGLFGGAGQAT